VADWSLLFIVSLTPIFPTQSPRSKSNQIRSVIGYIISYLTYLPVIHHHNKTRRRDPNALSPESRLWWLLYLAPLLSIGLFGFSWTSLPPPQVHWIAPLIFTALVGVANYAVYKSSIGESNFSLRLLKGYVLTQTDYMIAAYGPYAASATGGNDLARDFLAGIAALYAHPCMLLFCRFPSTHYLMLPSCSVFFLALPERPLTCLIVYENVGPENRHLVYPSTILACLAIVVIIPIYIFYWKGPQIRTKSKFAMELEVGRRESVARRRSTVYGPGGAGKRNESEGGEKV
jgi:hypothetical protein